MLHELLDAHQSSTTLLSPINCEALDNFLAATYMISMGASSQLFVIRAVALWRRNRWVIAILSVLTLTQWSLYIVQLVNNHWRWDTLEERCVVQAVSLTPMKLIFISNMALDLCALVLTLWALLKLPGLSNIWALLFRDGLVYVGSQ